MNGGCALALPPNIAHADARGGRTLWREFARKNLPGNAGSQQKEVLTKTFSQLVK